MVKIADHNDPYEAVCDRVEQELAQLKNTDSVKLSGLRFLRLLMTMCIFIFHSELRTRPFFSAAKHTQKWSNQAGERREEGTPDKFNPGTKNKSCVHGGR